MDKNEQFEIEVSLLKADTYLALGHTLDNEILDWRCINAASDMVAISVAFDFAVKEELAICSVYGKYDGENACLICQLMF